MVLMNETRRTWFVFVALCHLSEFCLIVSLDMSHMSDILQSATCFSVGVVLLANNTGCSRKKGTKLNALQLYDRESQSRVVLPKYSEIV